MRTVSGGDATLLAQAHVNHYVRVYVTGQPHGATPGVETLLTSLGGTDWVDSVSWDGETVDRQIATATIQLKRDLTGGTSLAPLIAGSPLNVDAGGSVYAPLLSVGAALRITTAVTDHGVAPASGDWKEVFRGRIDSVDWSGDPITVQCSDLGAWLMDTAIQSTPTYGSNSGATVESIMQAILTDWPSGMGTATLYELNSSGVATLPGAAGALSPSWTIPKSYVQQPMPVLEALNNLVSQFGWALRYHYDTAGTYALTLYEPPRSTTTSLATIATSAYREVQKCAQAIADVRNSFALDYVPTAGGTATVTLTDSSSIAAYGTRFMRLAGDSVANIRTSTDATTMLTAIKADLSAPKLDHEVQLLYYWPAQAYDLYTFPANGAHYDSDQKLAVMSVKHEAKGGEITTTLQVRGSVIGSFADWLGKRIVTPLSGSGSSIIGIYWASIVDAPTTVSGYGITDVYTKTAGDARYAYVGGSNASGTWGINITGSAGSVTNGVLTTGSYADPSWITSLAGSKISGNISGNAGTATKLATARALWGQSFDGSAAVTGALSGVTTIAASGTATISSTTALAFSYAGNADLQLSNASGVFRIVNAAYTVAAMTVTQAGVVSAGSSFSGPLTGTVTGSLIGNADTATKLATARAINGVNFDGSAAITVTAAAGTLSGATLASGVTASSLTSVGTLASLTVTGTVTAGGLVSTSDWTFQGAAGKTIYALNVAGTDYTTLTVNSGTFYIFAGTTAQGNAQRFSQTYNQATFTTPVTATSFSGPLTGAVTGNVTGNLTGAVTGNASTATALATARAINSVNFDGTAAITVTAAAGTLSGATLASGVTASSLTSHGTLVSGNVPASLVTSGTFGAGAYTFPGALAITGAFTGATTGAFSGQITSTVGNNTTVLVNTSATTGYQQIYFQNTSGGVRLAVNGSTAAALLTGGNAYAATLDNLGLYPLDFGTNGVRRGGFSAAGAFDLTSTLAVTGDVTGGSHASFGVSATIESPIALKGKSSTATSASYAFFCRDSADGGLFNVRGDGLVTVPGTLGVTGAATFSSTVTLLSASPTLVIKDSTAAVTGGIYGTLEFRSSDGSMPASGVAGRIDTYDDGGVYGDRSAMRFYVNNSSALYKWLEVSSAGAATFSSTVTLAQDIQYSSNSGYGILSANSTRVLAIRNTGLNVTGSLGVTGTATAADFVLA